MLLDFTLSLCFCTCVWVSRQGCRTQGLQMPASTMHHQSTGNPIRPAFFEQFQSHFKDCFDPDTRYDSILVLQSLFPSLTRDLEAVMLMPLTFLRLTAHTVTLPPPWRLHLTSQSTWLLHHYEGISGSALELGVMYIHFLSALCDMTPGPSRGKI